MGPVEKGVTKIQETFHRKSESLDNNEEETDLEVEENFTATDNSVNV